jgi:pyrroline-5-carboxylate reductase
MVASFFEFHHGFALVASLPAFFFGLIKEFIRLFVTRALKRAMPLRTAFGTNFGIATTTSSDPSTILASVKAGGFDPFATSF